ncbi:MAG: Rne/Rng family ribonuclease [Jatrophihabitantaceae bacterium]
MTGHSRLSLHTAPAVRQEHTEQMLDTEPTNTDNNSASGEAQAGTGRQSGAGSRRGSRSRSTAAPATPAAESAAAAAPAKKAARKAPAKKATAPEPTAAAGPPASAEAPTKAPRKARKAPAKKVAGSTRPADDAAGPNAAEPITAGPLVDPAAPVAPVAPAQPATGAAGSAQAARQAPATKAPRKRAARKAAPAAEPPADTIPSDPATEAAPAGAGPVETAPAATAPVKKATRKRAAKKAAPAAEQPAAGQAAAPEATESAAPALAAPSVLFQPPTEAAPRRRRSSRSARAEQSAEGAAAADQAPAGREPGDGELTDPVLAEDEAADSDTEPGDGSRRRRRRGRRGRGSKAADTVEAGSETAEAGEEDEAAEQLDVEHADEVAEAALSASARRRRRRRRSSGADAGEAAEDDPPNTVVHIRDGRSKAGAADDDGVRGVKGSTRLEAKRQRRRDNRDSGRRRAPILTEAEFLARREAVERVMAVRQTGDRTQIAVLEDGVLVEHYVTRASAASAVGNVYLARVQNVLPSMEAAFVDIGRGRNGVLYAGEVNWDSAGLEGKARSIENALSSGDAVLVQVTKDPIGHKGARLTSQVSLPGRFVVYVPGGGMTGISRKLPDTERSRLKAILKKVVPDEAGVIVRTAAEGASEQDLISDVERLKAEWEAITAKAAKKSSAPMLVHGEPDLAIRVVRDIFNDDFSKLIVSGSDIHHTLTDYVGNIAPDLADRISLHTAEADLFRELRVDEQLAKALDRKVWLPSGGSLVIDRTEAMTVIDVNTGKYTGSGGNLEQTVTRNNLEAAEEIVRQLRLRDLGGIVVIDFIDMVLESNRELVLRRLTECLGRDRTKHQVAEVTSLGLVQMTRKRVGEGLLEAFSEPCEHCHGRGVIVHLEPVDKKSGNASQPAAEEDRPARGRRSRATKSATGTKTAGVAKAGGARTAKGAAAATSDPAEIAVETEKRRAAASAVAAIAAATAGREGDREPIDAAHPNGAPDGAQPVTEVAHQAQPNEVEPADAKPATPRPRRRRAASRPAGPPTATTGTDG